MLFPSIMLWHLEILFLMFVVVIFFCIFYSVLPSSCGSEGPGLILIQTVKLAFSVTNNIIRLKPPSDVISPLEQALTQHGGHGNNLIIVLAKYIYHKHDPALPRLAIQLLKRLATVSASVLLYCFNWWSINAWGTMALYMRQACIRDKAFIF